MSAPQRTAQALRWRLATMYLWLSSLICLVNVCKDSLCLVKLSFAVCNESCAVVKELFVAAVAALELSSSCCSSVKAVCCLVELALSVCNLAASSVNVCCCVSIVVRNTLYCVLDIVTVSALEAHVQASGKEQSKANSHNLIVCFKDFTYLFKKRGQIQKDHLLSIGVPGRRASPDQSGC